MDKRYVYKMMDSPVGRLRLVATNEGLAAILWERDHTSRVPLNMVAEEDHHPVLVKAERQLTEYLEGQRKEFALALDPGAMRAVDAKAHLLALEGTVIA